MGGQATRLWTLRPLPGTRISLGGAIRAASPVPLEFPTYRGGCASEPRRDPAYRSTRGNPARDLLTLLQPQRHRRPPTCCWGNPSIQSQYAVNAALVPSLERSRNVGYTLTVPPALPKLGLLLRREPRPCVPLHTHTSSSGKIRRCCVDRLNPPSKADIECFGLPPVRLPRGTPSSVPHATLAALLRGVHKISDYGLPTQPPCS